MQERDEVIMAKKLDFDKTDTFIIFSSVNKTGVEEAWNAIYELCDLDFE